MPRTAWRDVLCKPSAVSYRQQELSCVAYNGADEHTHILKRQLSLVKIIGLLKKSIFPVSYHVYTCMPLDSCPEQCVQAYWDVVNVEMSVSITGSQIWLKCWFEV